jgi:hypothetical protein
MTRRTKNSFLLGIVLAAIPRPTAGGQEAWTKPAGQIAVEFGIDSLERKSYRPKWSFTLPLAFEGASRFAADLSYWQRGNGRLEGLVDFWLSARLEHRISSALSVEAGLDHFCRHLTSIRNPYVLNLNEAVGRVRYRGPNASAGFGLGAYVGGSEGYDGLALASLALPGFLLDELSLDVALKWVNFEDVLYEAGITLALGEGTEIFFRSIKTYALDRTALLGLRFLSEGRNARSVDAFDLSAGAYPFYKTHKLLVQGSYRLAFLREPGRLFFLEVDFRSPIIGGRSFFGEFWPDRMLTGIGAEYARRIGGIHAAWYGRYFVDMPADKDIPFRASLATGLALRNQPDFDRLENPLRFELRGGYDFKFDYDLGARIGLNTVGARFADTGVEFDILANAERRVAEVLVFAEFGGAVAVRPFVGIRKISYLAGGPPPPDPFRRKLTAGISFFKWLD